MVDNTIPKPGIAGGNPLAKHLRQPKIYIKLPSNGKYWPKGSIEMPESGEFAVYAMTARDEIAFKTPDALLNGQATVDVIQSCVPNIKDAWQTPSIDLDTLLIAIRMASFGETIDMSTRVPNTDIEKEFRFNLQNLYDKYTNTTFEDTFEIQGFTVEVKPVSYKISTEQSIKAFEQQRIFNIVNDNSLNDGQKLKQFQDSFRKLTDINLNVMIESVTAIQPDGDDVAVTNKIHLQEFLSNCEAKTFNEIQDHIKAQREKFTQAPVDVEATEEEIAAGAPKVYSIPVTFDQSNFFG